MKEIKDYLHFYLGCECKFENDVFTLAAVYNHSIVYSTDSDESGEGIYGIEDCKPILRPLSDMTEGEKVYLGFGAMIHNEIVWTPKKFLYALSKHFDLFGLIEAGIAIDKITLK